jgi:hypothetical protein
MRAPSRLGAQSNSGREQVLKSKRNGALRSMIQSDDRNNNKRQLPINETYVDRKTNFFFISATLQAYDALLPCRKARQKYGMGRKQPPLQWCLEKKKKSNDSDPLF